MKSFILTLALLIQTISLCAQTNTIKRTDGYGEVSFLGEGIEICTKHIKTTELYVKISSFELTYYDICQQIKAVKELLSLTKDISSPDHNISFEVRPFESGDLIIHYTMNSGWDESNISYAYADEIDIVPGLRYDFTYEDFRRDGKLLRYRTYGVPRKIYSEHNLSQTYENLLALKQKLDVFIKEKKIDRQIIDIN